jgi:alpha-glucosidase (family GH31 glycosyl hydrolase)
VVRETRRAGIPMDVIHLDTNWFAVDWRCDLEFAPDRFPDPESLCRELAAEGVHLSLWQMPYLVEGTRLHDRLARAGGFVRTPEGTFLDIGVRFVRGYQGPVHAVDWTNPEALRVMREEYGRLFATGASVIKVEAEHGLDTMPLYLREGAVIPTGPVMRWVGERPTDPLTVVVAPFEAAGRSELRVPVDGREVAIRYEATAGRHTVEVEGHPGELVLDAPPGMELRR